MSISLLQWVQQLEARTKVLEAKVAEFEKKPVLLPSVHQPQLPQVAPTTEKPSRAMCPKCGVKPNHYFHVKWCGEKQDGDKATDGPGSNGSS